MRAPVALAGSSDLRFFGWIGLCVNISPFFLGRHSQYGEHLRLKPKDLVDTFAGEREIFSRQSDVDTQIYRHEYHE